MNGFPLAAPADDNVILTDKLWSAILVECGLRETTEVFKYQNNSPFIKVNPYGC